VLFERWQKTTRKVCQFKNGGIAIDARSVGKILY